MDVRAPGKRFEDKSFGAPHHRSRWSFVGAPNPRHRPDIIDWLEALVFNTF
jgi:hypothetical protein